MGATTQLERPSRYSQRLSGRGRPKPARGPLVPPGRNSDERLSRRATKGDRQALGAIFERYQQELYRFCLGLLGEPQDAQDALQNTMVKVLRALPGEKREIALRPWLYRIAHNEAVDLRRAKRETQTLDRHLLDSHSSVAETAENRERLQWLLRDLRNLPARQRAVLVMRELSGLDFADIGAALGTSGAVIRQALYEARRNLEQMDFGRNLSCEAVTRVLSAADGRVSGRREIRAHLGDCPDCRRFQEQIQVRKEALAGITPLSGGAAAGLLQLVLGGAGGSGAGGLAAVGAGSAGTVGVVKAVATVAAVMVIGATAAERSSHDRAAGDPAAAPSSQPSRASRQMPQITRASTPRETQSPARGPMEISPHSTASGPPLRLARTQPGVPVARGRFPQAAAPGSEFSAPATPPAGKSPPPREAAPELSASAPEAVEQPSSVMKQKEEAAAEPAATPEEGTQDAEPAPVPAPEAEASPAPESLPHNPNGKAKGHEKQLSS